MDIFWNNTMLMKTLTSPVLRMYINDTSLLFDLSSYISVQVFAEQGNVPNIIIAVSKSSRYLTFSTYTFPK